MRRLLVLMFGGALIVASAACGGDDDTAAVESEDTTTDDSGDETTTTEATDDGGEETTTTEATDDGGETTDDGGTTEEDVCALLTDEEVAAAVPEAGELQVEPAANACSWTSLDPFAVVTVTVQPGGLSTSSFDEAIEAAAGFMEGEFEAVEGIGDAAAQIGGSIPILFVADGETLLSVSVLSDTSGEEAQQELAQAILDKT